MFEINKEPAPKTNMGLQCKLYDKRADKWHDYTEAFYTKLDGTYGYICIDLLTVKFFWYYNGQVNWDDVTENYEVKYIIS